MTPSEPEGRKGKRKKHSEGLITAKKWTPIATHRSRKPQTSASIQGKPTSRACTGKINIINPVVTSKVKLPKSADNKFVKGTVKDLGFQRNQPEDREGLSRTRRPGGGHLGHSGGWQDNEGDNMNPAIHTSIKQKPQTRGLEQHGSTSSAPQTPQRFISIEHGQQEVQPGISLGRTWSKLPEDMSQSERLQRPYDNHQRLEYHQEVQTPGGEGKQDKGESSYYPSYRRTADPYRAYSDSFRLTRSRPNQLSSGFPPFRNQQAERVRTNDPETVVLGEGSTQEPEVVVNHSRISSPLNRNITPTQIEHNTVSPESNLNSDALWLQMSQFSEQTQKQFAELEASHERMKVLTASMDKIVKTLQIGHAQLSKASEETNRRLNLVFEEQHHSKRDRF
ncbi:hypothetical protein O181_069057 [Austropuccinia psidii MF-1]|uniref:Uncharacterized protein n=1 Tax=Austropuccinia psidii MF-1 TaxID=1389203 RepID=A0A9Q3F0J5_9BASI|nr:hypothetical protein [Austropuccinia psidii MF-1]